ncbi:Protein-glutamate methylesterase/protein-glutamine glutaminase 1 [Labeo rohita]|uniref:Protein-glutamate methylesterase/protein-glutamine glutaminase 1 n=1 Tax=Labeo rohita TaxID=84645 RepID=A0ABQ8LUS3_LABRO|nr:Protein-glutamate methylesterase/protein-glutamine glutaminase 1 [Labeo rohita]
MALNNNVVPPGSRNKVLPLTRLFMRNLRECPDLAADLCFQMINSK